MNGMRRGACPSLIAPMETGDGLLARLTAPDGGWHPRDVLVLVRAAMAHGNGLLEVTSRGSLQVRGLSPSTAEPFARAVGDRAAPDLGVTVHTAPFAGDDARAIARSFREWLVLRPLSGLAPKTAVVIDGGTALHLDGLSADVRAVLRDGVWRVAVHTTILPRRVAAAQVPAVLHRLLEALAEAAPGGRGSQALEAKGADFFAASIKNLSVPEVSGLKPRDTWEPIGRHELANGMVALGLGLAFGQAEAGALGALAEEALRFGARRIVPVPGRALLIGELRARDAAKFAAACTVLGFVAATADPRHRISACSGAPSCASGLLPSRLLAAELAGKLNGSTPDLHISGCPKGCAHPGVARITLVGRPDGVGVIRNGTARNDPEQVIDAASVSRWFAGFAHPIS